MIDVGFYQLAERRAENVVPQLAAKALAAGHRLVIRCADPLLLARIDDGLWSDAPGSFIPHGVEASLSIASSATQPVLLTAAPLPAANGADCLVQVGDDLPDDLAGLARVLYLFDTESLEIARARWRRLASADAMQPVYWREGEGGRFARAQ